MQPHSRKHIRPFRAVLILVFTINWLTALQAQHTFPTIQGRDFWLSYLHNGRYNEGTPFHSWFHHQIVATSNSNGSITVSVNSWSRTFSITAGDTLAISIPFNSTVFTNIPYEGTSHYYPDKIRSGRLLPFGIHVTSTTDITLCAFNNMDRSLDATSVLPTRSLGKNYILQDYNSNGTPDSNSIFDGGEFCIVATEDNTSVDILFNHDIVIDSFSTSGLDTFSHTFYAGSHYRTLTMNSGEVILLTTPQPHNISGTSITANKPIAVFMGRMYCKVNHNLNHPDHLFQQALPTELWGREFLILPDHRTDSSHNYFNIASLEDNCMVEFVTTSTGQGYPSQTLSAGEVRLFDMPDDHTPLYIKAGKPVSVCLYMNGGGSSLNNGDPSMVYIPPTEQGIRQIDFPTYRLAHTESCSTFRANVVVPTSAVGGMRLDGVDISNLFSVFDTTAYSYANVPVVEGTHTLSNSQGGFTAWLYAIANRFSYAYTAGMMLRNLKYELFVDGDNSHTWGDTLMFCTDSHHFKIQTEAATDTRWFVDGVMLPSTDTMLDHTFSSTGIHTVTALQRGSCTGPDFCDTLSFAVMIHIPQSDTFAVVPDTLRWYGTTYSQNTCDTLHLTNAEGCDSLRILHLTVSGYPDNVVNPSCTFQPDSNTFTMAELYSCQDGVHSMSTPMVADMDGDGIPEIIACRNGSSSHWYANGFLIFDGATGVLKKTISTPDYYVHGQCVSIADVDGDGTAEIFLLERAGFVQCYNYSGTRRWLSMTVIEHNYLLSVADINNDGVAELVCGRHIFNADDGTLLLQGSLQVSGMGFGSPHGHDAYALQYYMYALADIDGDGTLELCAGNTVYKIDITNTAGTTGNSWRILRQAESNASIVNPDGQTFVTDFDGDGDIDICVIGMSHNVGAYNIPTAPVQTVNTYVWDGQTTGIVAYDSIDNSASQYRNYSPSIPYSGDLDGDGKPEIAFSWFQVGMIRYTYDTTQQGNMRELQRQTSFGETTGLTAFDFNQDGRDEIVYRGTSSLYIVDGMTLDTLCTPLQATSNTLTEYPVVADVNGDGHAEIVVCRAYPPESTTETYWNGSVAVYGSAIPNAWSSARKVWNQWAYSAVNINEDLTVPRYRFNVAEQFPNGRQPFNGFLRQMPYIDRHGDRFNPVADIAEVQASYTLSNDSVTISVTYSNSGTCDLLSPYGIAIYKNSYRGELLSSDTISRMLHPDSTEAMVLKLPASELCSLAENDSIVIVINDFGNGIAQHGGLQTECDTTNNTYIFATPVFHNGSDTVVTACDSFEWYGNTISASTDTATHIFTNATGCDSTVTLHLTINSASSDNQSVALCCNQLPFTWRDTLMEIGTVSGNYIFHRTNAAGCDSTATLTLTVNDTNVVDMQAHLCESQLPYTWSGTVFNPTLTGRQPSVTSHSVQNLNIFGCDSTTTLHLSVYPTDSVIDQQQRCDSLVWLDGATYTTSTEGPILYFGNQYGCDSTVTLSLTINNSKLTDFTDSICIGSEYDFAGQILTAGGIYTRNLTAANGCDSVIRLALTVLSKPIVSVGSAAECETLTHHLHATSNVDYIHWSVDGNWNSNWGSEYGHNLTVSLSQTHTFTVLVDYNDYPTCPNTHSITLSPIIMPEAIINAKPDFLTNDNNTIVAISQSTGANWLRWYIDGEEVSNDVSITYAPDNNADSVIITLIASNTTCADTAGRIIPIRRFSIFAPTAFTPSESSNRTFNIVCNGVIEYEMSIFNRNGQCVFQSSSSEQPWDGRYKGIPCPKENYVWIVKYRSEADPQNWHTEKGSVLLLR